MTREFQKLRLEIDKIDKKLLKILADRFKITKKIGKYKAKYSLPVCDEKREKEILKNRDLIAKKLNLERKLVKEIFKTILKTVRINHRKIKKSRFKKILGLLTVKEKLGS